MRLNDVLARLEQYGISIHEDRVEKDGSRTVIVAGRLPSPPYASKMAYYTLNMPVEIDIVELEEREAIRRRMWHLTTDIFGDDEAEGGEDFSTDVSDSLLHTIVAKAAN
jgi:hypothetical protein